MYSQQLQVEIRRQVDQGRNISHLSLRLRQLTQANGSWEVVVEAEGAPDGSDGPSSGEDGDMLRCCQVRDGCRRAAMTENQKTSGTFELRLRAPNPMYTFPVRRRQVQLSLEPSRSIFVTPLAGRLPE